VMPQGIFSSVMPAGAAKWVTKYRFGVDLGTYSGIL